VVVHTCNPATWEVETGGPRFKDSLAKVSETLSQKEARCDGTYLWSSKKKRSIFRIYLSKKIHPHNLSHPTKEEAKEAGRVEGPH
jgi:hypothetical protein